MNGLVQILQYADDVLLVRWRKPGHADEEEQRWIPGRALRSGQCSFSGAKVVCGDAVFSPKGASAHARMILVSALDSTYRSTARPKIEILEHVQDMLLVRWVEPGRAHYGEQTWRLTRASRPGICVLSGAEIVPGYEVFRPSGRPAPSNARAMIWAAVLSKLSIERR